MTVKEFMCCSTRIREGMSFKLEQAKIVKELQEEAVFAQGSTGENRKNNHSVKMLRKLEKNISAELESLCSQGQEIFSLVDRLGNPNHRTVLTLRYICGMRWGEIAKRMHYSIRHLNRMHNQALEELEAMDKGE